MRRTSSIRAPYHHPFGMSFVLMRARWHPGTMSTTGTSLHDDTVVIRRAVSADAKDLVRLAVLDSQAPLRGVVLVAESDGVVRAAYSPDEHRAIADPFRPTAALVALLRTRAQLMHGARAALARRAHPLPLPRRALATRS